MAWWVTLWVLSAIMSMTTPPVSGGTISCLTIMLNQLGVPAEGLAIAVTLAMFLDFICTGTRIPILHMELMVQAERLGMLDYSVLQKSKQD